ncbi:ABC transporter permease [Cytophagales bacterium WSM2-2]|nr:ABC transporter permease [Cytophagales bacterium WSM2-2]
MNEPPKLASRFLAWYCPASLREGIEGDLFEKFEADRSEMSKRRAQLNYWGNVIRFFRPGIILRNKFRNPLFQNFMLKNYLKTAFRSLWRAKAHTSINVFGLALGIGCCVLISLFVRDEMTFDRFHTKADRIYRVYGREDWGEKQQFFYTTTPFPMGPALKSNLPEVEAYVRINALGTQVKIGQSQFNENVTIGGQSFFDVFDFEIISGNREALKGQSHVVLSEQMAKKYFGDADPINKTISIQLGEKFEDFTVKTVVKNIPTNSSIQFDILISDLNYPKLYNERILTSAWFNIGPATYLLLQKGSTGSSVEKKFPAIFRTLLGEEDFTKSKYAPGLQPLTDIHLDTNFPRGNVPVSNPKYSYILAAIAVLILLIACINFVTLSVGRSIQRAKEVGIRKVVGAMRRQLVTQFIGEAVIVTLIALLIGLGLSALNLPIFNDLAGKQLAFKMDQFLWLVIGALLLIVGMISGSYPAFVLSAFKPAAILKSGQAGSSKQGVRKILVGTQLVLSVFLISSTLLMRQQLQYLQNKDMGFDKEQLACMQLNVPRASGGLAARVSAGFEKAERFKAELGKFPDIIGACATIHDFGNGNWVNVGYTDDKKVYRTFNINVIDDKYVPTMKLDMVAGRNFSDANPSDKRRSVLVNEAFVKAYGWADPIGKKIPGKDFPDHEIIGVVKDFNYASLYNKVDPLVMVEDASIILKGIENIDFDAPPIPKLMVRIKPGNMAATLDQLKTVWNKINGEEEFSISFVDQTMAKQYRNDQNLGKMVSIAALLAVVIGSLGLYALASLAMQNRTKEISIRKVMGASEQSLFYLLSKEYLLLVVLCLAVSVPITWYLMSSWLSTFVYRVNITASVFVLAGIISLLIALSTISYQLFKTVWTNPVKNLKYE